MTFITAEIGVNWAGDYQLLEFLIIQCKKMNINAIKLQALTPELIKRHKELTYYASSSVNPDNIDRISELFKRYEFEWYCTPTEPQHVKMLEPYVNRYKIRCADSNNKKLCEAVFSTAKKVIISSTRPLRYDNKMIKNLYCVPRYPTSFEEHNFELMKQFDGFSNHSKNPLVLLKAVMMGLEFIEFHITPTNDIFLLDNHVSFTPEQVNEFMRWISIYNERKLAVARAKNL